MDGPSVENGFETWALPQERVTALIGAGIPEAGIAEAVGVNIQSVKNWHEGKTAKPNERHVEKLDNLRCAMKMIIDNGVAPDYAAAWMQSPIGENPGNAPIYHINQDPELVLGGIGKIFGSKEAEENPLTSFGEVFANRRSVRGIKMQEFKTVGIGSTYIHAIERQDMLPKPGKRDVLLDFMGTVATEQDADGDLEKQILLEAWWEAQLKRLEVGPKIAPIVAKFLALDPEKQEAAAQALHEFIKE